MVCWYLVWYGAEVIYFFVHKEDNYIDLWGFGVIKCYLYYLDSSGAMEDREK